VLGLHPFGAGALHMVSNDGTLERAAKGNVIQVHPEGLADTPPGKVASPVWNAVGSSVSSGATDETCWHGVAKDRHFLPDVCYTSCGESCSACSWSSCADDVGFVELMLNTLEAQLCVDRSKIRAHGSSNGGMMVFELLQSRLAGRFEAVASVSGLPQWKAQRIPQGAPRFLGVWGASDAYVPPDPHPQTTRKDVTLSAEGLYFISAQNATETIAESPAYGCQATVTPVVTTVPADEARNLQCLAFVGCYAGEVVNCRFNGGHEWPDEVTTLLWDFYDAGVVWMQPTPLPAVTALQSVRARKNLRHPRPLQ
jgi:poly(3-hydroxybutyrate) depolymerase